MGPIVVIEAFLDRPETVIRELRLTSRYRDDYVPPIGRFEAGFPVAEPVEFEVFIPEDRVSWETMRDHLATVDHTIFGRYEQTTYLYRTERRRQGVRVVFRDAIEAVYFKLLLG